MAKTLKQPHALPRKKPNPAPAVSSEAKVFMTGRSQAVRLPKEYRIRGDAVFIKRFGKGLLLLPKTEERWGGLFAALDEFPRDFDLDREQSQRRSGLNRLFDPKRR